uniref:Putative secreted salivary protein n=1 Tax=Ixodes scapularis TaxID=6945 RepID=Q4PMR2_IXOSC|nr:putative secreted salivary protein [Ixodes scapularis]
MQLALFIVILTFALLSCEEELEASPDIFGEMKHLPQDCKTNLKEQIQNRCSGHKYQPLLLEVKDCKIVCGDWHDNGVTKATTRHTINLKDGTPCGHSRVCVKGECVDTCRMTFV